MSTRMSQRVRKRAQEQEDASTAALDDLLRSLELEMTGAAAGDQATASAAGGADGVGGKPPPLRRKKGLVVFTGAGLSASTGMSTFSTPGGLYDRAKKRLKMPASGDGSRLFHARALAAREGDVHAFLAELAGEAARAAPGEGHLALARLAGAGKLVRHYTLNVDGLAGEAGMRLWDWDQGRRDGGGGGDGAASGDAEEEEEEEQDGTTVELHGNVRRMVCRSCGARADLTPALLRDMRDGRPLQCPRAAAATNGGGGSGGGGNGREEEEEEQDQAARCPPGSGRTGILLYDDPDAALITPAGPTWRLLERDLPRAAAVVWAGISFEQSASVGYFSRVVGTLRRIARSAEKGEEGDAARAEEEQVGEEEEEKQAEPTQQARRSGGGGGSGRAAAARRPPPPPLPPQVLINPSEDAMFNLLSGAGAEDLGEDVRVVELRMDTDAALPAIAARLGGGSGGAD